MGVGSRAWSGCLLSCSGGWEGTGLRLPGFHPLSGFVSAAGVGLRGHSAAGGPGGSGCGGGQERGALEWTGGWGAHEPLLSAASCWKDHQLPRPRRAAGSPCPRGQAWGGRSVTLALLPRNPWLVMVTESPALRECIKGRLMGLVTHRWLAPWGGWGLRTSVSGKREGAGCRALRDVDPQVGLRAAGSPGAGWPSVC